MYSTAGTRTGLTGFNENGVIYTDRPILSFLEVDNNTYVSGQFNNIGRIADQKVTNFAITNATTGAWDNLIEKTLFNGDVHNGLIVGNYIYLVGNFTKYNGLICNNIAKISLLNGELDLTFSSGTGVGNAFVYDIKIDSSGTNLYIAGSFTTYNGTAANGMAKINAQTGLLNVDFNTSIGFNGVVYSFVIDETTNKIYAVGSFSAFRGTAISRIAKINTSDATLDTSFIVGSGLNTDAYKIIIDDLKTSLYVVGNFTTYNGVAASRIVKINATDGSRNSSFNIGTGFNAVTSQIILNSANTFVYVSGAFSTYNGSTYQGVIKLNSSSGAVDATFNTVSGITNISVVHSLYLDEINNFLYIGGNFTAYKSVSVTHLIRINSIDATRDSSYNPSFMDLSINIFVRFVIKDNTNRLFIGGTFFNYLNINSMYNRQGIAKFNSSTGEIDPVFDTSTGFSANTGPSQIVINSSKTILYTMGSSLSQYKGVVISTGIAINAITGAAITNPSIDGLGSGACNKLIIDNSDRFLYACGSFTSYKGSNAFRLVKIDLLNNGAADPTFPTGDSAFNATVQDMVINSTETSLFLTGNFTTYKGVPANRIIKLNTSDASRDTGFIIGVGLNSTGNSLALTSTNNFLYVGGGFTSYNGTQRQYIAKINASDGTIDNTFDTLVGANGIVNKIVLDSDQTFLFVSGSFTSYKSVTISNIRLIKIDASTAIRNTNFDTISGIRTNSVLIPRIFLTNSKHLYFCVSSSYLYYKDSFSPYQTLICQSNAYPHRQYK